MCIRYVGLYLQCYRRLMGSHGWNALTDSFLDEELKAKGDEVAWSRSPNLRQSCEWKSDFELLVRNFDLEPTVSEEQTLFFLEWDDWVVLISLILWDMDPTRKKTTVCMCVTFFKWLVRLSLSKQFWMLWITQKWRTVKEDPILKRKQQRCTRAARKKSSLKCLCFSYDVASYVYGGDFLGRKSVLNGISEASKSHREAENELEFLQPVTWLFTGQAKDTRASFTWHLSDSDKL